MEHKTAHLLEALFPDKPLEFKLPSLHHTAMEHAMDEKELWDFPLCDSFELVDAGPSQFTYARKLAACVGKTVGVLVYYITQKPVRTKNGQIMYFGTFIDSSGDWVDSVHFPDVAQKHRLTGRGYYHLRGKVVEEFGVHSLEVSRLKKLGLKNEI